MLVFVAYESYICLAKSHPFCHHGRACGCYFSCPVQVCNTMLDARLLKSFPQDNFETRYLPILLFCIQQNYHTVPCPSFNAFRLIPYKFWKAEVAYWCQLLPQHFEIPQINLSQNPKGFCLSCRSFSPVFILLPIYFLSVFFCAHLCPCVRKTAVASSCFFSWLGCCLICVAAAPGSCCMGYISTSVNKERLRGVTSASPFPPVKRPPGKEGGVLAFFPDAFSSLIPSSVTLLPLLCLLPPSGSEWQKMSWSFQTSCSLTAVRSCPGLVRPVTLLGVLELDLHIRCFTSQFHRNMPLDPENTCSLTLYCKHTKRGSAQFPFLEIFATRLAKALSNLVWSHCWPCSEPEVQDFLRSLPGQVIPWWTMELCFF